MICIIFTWIYKDYQLPVWFVCKSAVKHYQLTVCPFVKKNQYSCKLVHVCVCVCVCACMRVCVCVHTHSHMHTLGCMLWEHSPATELRGVVAEKSMMPSFYQKSWAARRPRTASTTSASLSRSTRTSSPPWCRVATWLRWAHTSKLPSTQSRRRPSGSLCPACSTQS